MSVIQRREIDSYSLGYQSGVMAAGLAGAAPILAFRWASSSLYCVVRSLRLSAGNLGTAFAAGGVVFDLIMARTWTANDTGGGAVAWTVTGSGKRAASITDSAFSTTGEIRASATATLTAGTRTLDTNPLTTVVTGIVAVAGSSLLPVTELVPQHARPIVLTVNTGLVLRATVPATGTWTFGLAVDWEEVSDL